MRPEYRERQERAKQPIYERKERGIKTVVRLPRIFSEVLQICAESEAIEGDYLVVNGLITEGIMRVIDDRAGDPAYMARLSEENRQALEQVSDNPPQP